MAKVESYFGLQAEHMPITRLGTHSPAHSGHGSDGADKCGGVSGTDEDGEDGEDRVTRRGRRFGGGLNSAQKSLARLSAMDVNIVENRELSSGSPLRRGSNEAYPTSPGTPIDATDFYSRGYGLPPSNSGGSSPLSTSPRRGLFNRFGRKSANPTPESSPSSLKRSMIGNDLTGRHTPAHMQLKGERAASGGGSSPLSSRTMSVMSRATQWLNDL